MAIEFAACFQLNSAMYCGTPSVPLSAKISLDPNMSVLCGGMNHFSSHPSIPVVVRIATAENFAQDKNVSFFFLLLKFLFRFLHRQNSHSLYIYFFIYIKKLSVFKSNVPNCHLFQ